MREEYKTFTCSYRYEGGDWNVTFKARSFEDAEARLAAMSLGRVEGIVGAVIPAFGPPWLMARFMNLWCKIANLMRKR